MDTEAGIFIAKGGTFPVREFPRDGNGEVDG